MVEAYGEMQIILTVVIPPHIFSPSMYLLNICFYSITGHIISLRTLS